MKIRIYYEDTDAGGVVYHSKYLNFCERARSELFFDKNPCIFDKNLGHFLVTKIECEYKKPAKLGDMIEVKSKVLAVKKASIVLEQEICKDDERLFYARFVLAFVKDERASAMSEELRSFLQSCEF